MFNGWFSIPDPWSRPAFRKSYSYWAPAVHCGTLGFLHRKKGGNHVENSLKTHWKPMKTHGKPVKTHENIWKPMPSLREGSTFVVLHIYVHRRITNQRHDIKWVVLVSQVIGKWHWLATETVLEFAGLYNKIELHSTSKLLLCSKELGERGWKAIKMPLSLGRPDASSITSWTNIAIGRLGIAQWNGFWTWDNRNKKRSSGDLNNYSVVGYKLCLSMYVM